MTSYKGMNVEASSKTGGVTDGGQTDNMKCDTNIEGSRWGQTGHRSQAHEGGGC